MDTNNLLYNFYIKIVRIKCFTKYLKDETKETVFENMWNIKMERKVANREREMTLK